MPRSAGWQGLKNVSFTPGIPSTGTGTTYVGISYLEVRIIRALAFRVQDPQLYYLQCLIGVVTETIGINLYDASSGYAGIEDEEKQKNGHHITV